MIEVFRINICDLNTISRNSYKYKWIAKIKINIDEYLGNGN